MGKDVPVGDGNSGSSKDEFATCLVVVDKASADRPAGHRPAAPPYWATLRVQLALLLFLSTAAAVTSSKCYLDRHTVVLFAGGVAAGLAGAATGLLYFCHGLCRVPMELAARVRGWTTGNGARHACAPLAHTLASSPNGRAASLCLLPWLLK